MNVHSVRVRRECQKPIAIRAYYSTCFHKEMIGLCLCGVLVACNSLKTMTTDKLYQRIGYYCMLIYSQSLIWPATKPHHLLNFGLEKIVPRTIKLPFITCILYKHKTTKHLKGSIVYSTKLK